jgi:hypothetical protein
MSGEEGYTKRVQNVEDAREVAEAEKPVRDAARRPGVTPEVKTKLDQAADRTGEQTISAQEKQKSFVGERTVNGLAISMKWNDKVGRYYFSFPEISIDETNAGMYGTRMDIVEPEIAKEVFDFACEFAQKEADPLKVFSRVAKFTEGIYND